MCTVTKRCTQYAQNNRCLAFLCSHSLVKFSAGKIWTGFLTRWNETTARLNPSKSFFFLQIMQPFLRYTTMDSFKRKATKTSKHCWYHTCSMVCDSEMKKIMARCMDFFFLVRRWRYWHWLFLENFVSKDKTLRFNWRVSVDTLLLCAIFKAQTTERMRAFS